MADFLQYEFMRNALAAGLLAAVATGVVGSLVVVNRVVFISGGIAHAAYGGVGVALFFSLDPLLGATVFGVAVALSMGAVQRLSQQRVDTLIGVMWAVGMAIGVIFVDLTPGYKADLMSFLFGSILAVPTSELVLMAVLDVVVVTFVALYFRPLLAVSYDETFARVRNLPVAGLQLALLCLVALSVVLLMRVVGLILVIAMLTIPAAIGGRFTRSLKGMMALAIAFGAAFNVIGLGVSYAADLTSGATIILVAAAGFLLASLLTSRTGLRRRDPTRRSPMR
jgi:zinc transport system permease protein